MTRTAEIRKELRWQYSRGAINERLVAKLRHEMSGLRHHHEWIDGSSFTAKPIPWAIHECKFCFWGRDEYLMDLEAILAEIKAREDFFKPLPHTHRGEVIGLEGRPYGVTHDMDCPACQGTPFTLSPRSETYWSS